MDKMTKETLENLSWAQAQKWSAERQNRINALVLAATGAENVWAHPDGHYMVGDRRLIKQG